MRGNHADDRACQHPDGSIPASAGEPFSVADRRVSRRVYPRECGGTHRGRLRPGVLQGLSPRVRGNRSSSAAVTSAIGSIPASAGEPPSYWYPVAVTGVYPRECGGTGAGAAGCARHRGLSPRVRGNRRVGHQIHAVPGSIPASAGEPYESMRELSQARVYPRECGGTIEQWDAGEDGHGLSPRVRGNRQASSPSRGKRGSIPASAGEPRTRTAATAPSGVYPRECGGTRPRGWRRAGCGGLSPRVRGNPAGRRRTGTRSRSIPASAGEPGGRRSRAATAAVYPRECGGTRQAIADVEPNEGLSPRVRGNRQGGAGAGSQSGSIPASAGEPTHLREVVAQGRVYPRECGGTQPASTHIGAGFGLSPRVRGNRLASARMGHQRGSIPASAGEPPASRGAMPGEMVYPRECGGTRVELLRRRKVEGLSPRVRGNRCDDLPCQRERGSIPASAGEPEGPCSPAHAKRVYPRECGGTIALLDINATLAGLSPRVRGNPWTNSSGCGLARSIPASAGEPRGTRASRRASGVYPRECGGTQIARIADSLQEGLSPRVRGNRYRRRRVRGRAGSIPASAGEPPAALRPTQSPRVYPRECGGTAALQCSSFCNKGLSPRVRGNREGGPDRERLAGSIPASAGEPSVAVAAPGQSRVYPRECGGTRLTRATAPARSGLSPRVRGNPAQRVLRAQAGGSIPASAGEPGSR